MRIRHTGIRKHQKTMVPELLEKYIWLINTFLRAREHGISLPELQEMWERRYDTAYSRSSFNHHREAVSQIRRKISPAVYEKVYLASLSRETDKADWIYRFLVSGFQYGSAVMEMLHLEEVSRIMKMCRFVQNESHLLTGFLRFAQAGGDLLIGRIGPKNDVLPLLAWHFSDRLAGENWMIYDEHRKKAVLHPAGGRWFVLNKEDEAWQEKLSWKTDEEEYQALWRTFHETAAIPERANALCQRTHLPLRYRPYMTEFQKGNPRGI